MNACRVSLVEKPLFPLDNIADQVAQGRGWQFERDQGFQRFSEVGEQPSSCVYTFCDLVYLCCVVSSELSMPVV